MILSESEASNKELIITIKKENEETRATIRNENGETSQKNFRGILKNTCGNKKERSLRKPDIWKNEYKLFSYQTKPQQHLYKTDKEVLSAKKKTWITFGIKTLRLRK